MQVLRPYLELHTRNKLITLLITYTNKRPRSPITLRSHQAYSAVTGVMDNGPVHVLQCTDMMTRNWLMIIIGAQKVKG